MSAPISDVVDVVVTTESASVQSQGFGKGLALTTHVNWTQRTREYSAPSQLVTDGWLTTDPVYIAASRYFDQNPAPLKFKVGRRQVNTLNIAITVVNGATYTVTINGTAYTYTADGSATEQEIVDGLIAAIAASPVTGTDGGANTLTITADVAGVAFSCSVGANLAIGALTAAGTIAADLDAIVLQDTDFYGVMLVSDRSSASMQAGAAWCLTNKRFFFASTQEADVVDVVVASDTTTLPAVLKAASNDRALTFYHADANANFIDAAAAGWILAHTPGSYTFALKTLLGILVSTLTPTQRTNALAKNCNVYEERGGINQVNDGRMASGKKSDQIHGRDWLSNQIAVNIFALLSSVDKVPFTDDGIAQIETKAKQAGAQGVGNNYLATYVTTMPTEASFTSEQKALRRLTGGKMVVKESGAIEGVQFNLIVQL